MAEKEVLLPPEQVIVPCSRAFFVYYVAIAIFILGPRFNPNVTLPGGFHFTATVGTVLGLIVLGLVIYLKLGREYRITSRGVMTLWRWPQPRQQEITWENLGDVLLRRGLTQTILRVGNLILQDKSGGPAMFWFGLANPKEIQEEIKRRRP